MSETAFEKTEGMTAEEARLDALAEVRDEALKRADNLLGKLIGSREQEIRANALRDFAADLTDQIIKEQP